MRALIAGGAAVLLAVGLAAASGAASSQGRSVVRLAPNARASKLSGTQAVGWASSNWSGYAAQHSSSYTGVIGNWTVPRVTGCSAHGRIAACYSAAWAGIDGFDNSSLIQTGTEQDYSGSASYSAWWTTSSLGFVEQTISSGCTSGSTNCGTVTASDQMTANITISGGTGTMTLTDHSQGWTFIKSASYTGPADSAEWIMEAPTVGGKIATMPNFETFAFDPDSVNGNANPSLVVSDGGELLKGRKVVSIPSNPDSDTDGFNMAYGSVAPNPPSS
jgi:Peptidase A4 family